MNISNWAKITDIQKSKSAALVAEMLLGDTNEVNSKIFKEAINKIVQRGALPSWPQHSHREIMEALRPHIP